MRPSLAARFPGSPLSCTWAARHAPATNNSISRLAPPRVQLGSNSSCDPNNDEGDCLTPTRESDCDSDCDCAPDADPVDSQSATEAQDERSLGGVRVVVVGANALWRRRGSVGPSTSIAPIGGAKSCSSIANSVAISIATSSTKSNIHSRPISSGGRASELELAQAERPFARPPNNEQPAYRRTSLPASDFGPMNPTYWAPAPNLHVVVVQFVYIK